MRKLGNRDFETRSSLDLAAVGPWRYASDPTTEVLCVGYAVDDEPVKTWLPGQPISEEFHEAARNSDWLAVAHNAQFEIAGEIGMLGPRFSWPQIPIERHRCTLAIALAAALPGKLDNVAAALVLSFQKDRDGQRLMRRLARRGAVAPDAEDLRRLFKYCRRHVEVARALFHRLPQLSETEQALWLLDFQINQRGFHIDCRLAEAPRKLTANEQNAIYRAIESLTNGEITSPNQVARIRAFVELRGHTLKTLSRRSVAAVLADDPGLRCKTTPMPWR